MVLKERSAAANGNRFRVLYQTELEEEAEWQRRGASAKVDSIEELLGRHGIRPMRLLELGCGTGAVIAECRRRNLAAAYAGLDNAPEAIDYLRSHSEGIDTVEADVTTAGFHWSDHCDVVVLSHVLEHLGSPAALLRTIKGSADFSYLVVEVPLENLFAGRIKSLLRPRSDNKAGHVQFFTARSLEDLVRSSGFRVTDRRTYVPILDPETVRFLAKKDALSYSRYAIKVLTNCYLPRILGPVWKRLYFAHHAILCSVDG